jgi:hypothetical protein
MLTITPMFVLQAIAAANAAQPRNNAWGSVGKLTLEATDILVV